MEHVVRSGWVQRTSAVTAALVGAVLLVVSAVVAESPIATVVGAVAVAAAWGAAMLVLGRRAPLDLRTVPATELPPVEPTGRVLATIVALHLVLGAVLLALVLSPVGPTLGIPAGTALGAALVYGGSWRRIERAETEGGGTIWSTSSLAWTSTQAKARTNYLVPDACSPAPTAIPSGERRP